MIIKIKKINYEIKFHPGGDKNTLKLAETLLAKKNLTCKTCGWDTDGQKSKVSSE